MLTKYFLLSDLKGLEHYEMFRPNYPSDNIFFMVPGTNNHLIIGVERQWELSKNIKTYLNSINISFMVIGNNLKDNVINDNKNWARNIVNSMWFTYSIRTLGYKPRFYNKKEWLTSSNIMLDSSQYNQENLYKIIGDKINFLIKNNIFKKTPTPEELHTFCSELALVWNYDYINKLKNNN